MIEIGDRNLEIADFYNILFNRESIEISPKTRERIISSYDFLRDFSVGKTIYGVNTGLGPMAQYEIDSEDQEKLQSNLIRSHAAGSGEILPEVYIKAAMIARLRSLLLGYSGVHPDVIRLLEALINNDIIPCIPEHGGVGASGDLVQLSHLALTLIGEGEVKYKGQIQETGKIFKELNLSPITCHLRDGLALINGTSIMTGIGVVNYIHSNNIITWSVIASSLINEIVKSFDDHISLELNSTKRHHGQHLIAKAMRDLIQGSRLIKRRMDNSYKIKNGDKRVFEEKVQEYYSLRCVPQILGPVYETVKNAGRIVIDEVNSVNDNPIVDVEKKQVYHGGNFHGDYISFEMDKMKIAITKLSILAERQLNFLLTERLNEVLPPFLNLGTLGLNLGLQGTQFTATSTVAENQTLANPIYIHSIPNNSDNQDVVSMGTNAALLCSRVIENTYQVLSVEFLAILFAIEHLKIRADLSEKSQEFFDVMERLVQIAPEDSVKYKDLEAIREHLTSNMPDVITEH